MPLTSLRVCFNPVSVPLAWTMTAGALDRDPEGSEARAFVAVTGDNHVAVIDLTTLQVTAKIETGQG